MNLSHKIPIRKLSLPWIVEVCTIDESIKGAASLRRYGITFDGNIDIMYPFPKLGWTKVAKHCLVLCEKMMQLLWYWHAYLKTIRNYFMSFSTWKIRFYSSCSSYCSIYVQMYNLFLKVQKKSIISIHKIWASKLLAKLKTSQLSLP